MSFVKNEWESFTIKGRKYFAIKEKLKLLRERLRWWNKIIFGWIDLEVEDEVEELSKIIRWVVE